MPVKLPKTQKFVFFLPIVRLISHKFKIMGASKKQTLGIMGGSFDPIHLGHIMLARAAVETGTVDEIVFVPAFQAPLRDAPVRSSAQNRLDMLSIALRNFAPPHYISTFEMERGGTSYAIDTAKYLAEENPKKDIIWIVGADHIAKLPKWHEIEKLSEIVSFACAVREGFSADTSHLPSFIKLEFFDFTPVPHSSTEIRNALARGERHLNMLDPEVENYILKNKLYNT